MIAFQVDDMTCGHCVAAVSRAVKDLDANARVDIDLARHRVQVEPATSDAASLARAIEDAGFTPVPFVGDGAGAG
jgi:copper chaperone